MKKFFAVIAVMLCTAFPAFSEVEQDTELHRVIGGLYTLASAVNLNGSTNPSITQLRRYFGNDAPDEVSSRVIRSGGAVWAGVSVGRYSSARHYLRSHAQELGILDSPGGYAWLGGDYAWLKAADISGDALRPAALTAARGTGSDSGVIFLSTQGQEQWWQANPSFSENSAKMIMDMFGVRDAPELHKPSGVSRSVYDAVRPNSVRMPGEMRLGTKKSSYDMTIEMGDVIFNPIPSVAR